MNKTPEQIVADIDEILTVIWKSLENPQILSEMILRLSVLYAGLGNHLVEARMGERDAERDYKYEVDLGKLEYVAKGDSATVAESKAKLDCYEDQINFHTAQKRVDMLKYKREDVERILDATRSRLSLIKGDIRNQ